MGITIHWDLASKAKRAATVGVKLERVRRACLKLPFKTVGEVEHLSTETCAAGPDAPGLDDDARWALILSRKHVTTGSGYEEVAPLEIVRLSLWAGEGCESTNLTLARYAAEAGWSGRGFTKTQYATHFVESHLLVIAALDACRSAGILKDVEDEGGFWETRDMTTLAGNINANTAMIRRVHEQLRCALGNRVESPIESCRNYVRVTSEGK